MREHFGREPDINRRALAIWMPISLAVAVLLLWLGFHLSPPGGAGSVQTLPVSSQMGAVGFTYLLSWAAFAYAASISTPHNRTTHNLLGLSLVLPIAAVLALNYSVYILALLLAGGWLGVLVFTALRLAKREPLAGLMFLPLIGSAGGSILLPLIYWAIH